MNYQILARKWRPQTFSNVVGQKHILIAIEKSLSIGRIHHSYLFSGTRGIGKTSIARILTKSFNCIKGVTATPCGVCNNCFEIEQGRFIDLIEIDAASRTKVEDTRELLDNVQYAPVRGRFKIYLIDEVHMLSRYSFNALLKTLEEPPPHAKFFLATTDPQKIPLTVLSRCLQFHLKALDTDQICHHLEFILKEEKIIYELGAIRLLARAANGSLRDALNFTDQAIISSDESITIEVVNSMLRMVDYEQTLSLIEFIMTSNGEKAMFLINKMASYGVDWEIFLIEIQNLLHYIAMLQLSPNFLKKEMISIEKRIRKLANSVSPTNIQLYYQIFLIGRRELPFAPDKRMGVEMIILRALTSFSKESLSDSVLSLNKTTLDSTSMTVKP